KRLPQEGNCPDQERYGDDGSDEFPLPPRKAEYFAQIEAHRDLARAEDVGWRKSIEHPIIRSFARPIARRQRLSAPFGLNPPLFGLTPQADGHEMSRARLRSHLGLRTKNITRYGPPSRLTQQLGQ